MAVNLPRKRAVVNGRWQTHPVLRKRNRTTRAGRLETIGSWLGIWTTARDVYVRPRPGWPSLLIAASAVVAAAAAIAVTVVPAIDRGKRRGAALEQQRLARLASAYYSRLRVEQRARRGSVPASATETGARRLVERRILADARRRFDDGARTAGCQRYLDGRADPARVDKYECLVVTTPIAGRRGVLGIPYAARVDRDAGRYAFCKVNPVPGERSVPDPRRVATLTPECRLTT